MLQVVHGWKWSTNTRWRLHRLQRRCFGTGETVSSIVLSSVFGARSTCKVLQVILSFQTVKCDIVYDLLYATLVYSSGAGRDMHHEQKYSKVSNIKREKMWSRSEVKSLCFPLLPLLFPTTCNILSCHPCAQDSIPMYKKGLRKVALDTDHLK